VLKASQSPAKTDKDKKTASAIFAVSFSNLCLSAHTAVFVQETFF